MYEYTANTQYKRHCANLGRQNTAYERCQIACQKEIEIGAFLV